MTQEVKERIELVESWFEGHPRRVIEEELAAQWIKAQARIAALEQQLAEAREPKYEVCGATAEPIIRRWGWSQVCDLEKGHEGQHRGGGNCFRHGRYIGTQCPHWPTCAKSAVVLTKESADRALSPRTDTTEAK